MTNALESPSLAIRLDYGAGVAGEPRAAREIAEILMRPCFAALSRLSARRKDRWSKHAKPSVESIATYLADATNDAISMDTKRGQDLVASAEVENGVGRDAAPIVATRLQAYAAIPYVAESLEAVVTGVRDLASALGAAAGFISLEPSYGLAHRAAVAASRPKERTGIGEQRFRERRARLRYSDRIGTELAGVDWGTFLGPGHLERVDLGELRRSGAFARVVEVSPKLGYLQISNDPLDDLTDGFEARLALARRALAPLLMDVSSISME
ncbi:MAG: hypothetical protein E6J91_19925 [Deltaproteobacteria bacterium]|nr:MAG: hypothetical protein E6J91_19925 [Deltaproteobacteria bacterium]